MGQILDKRDIYKEVLVVLSYFNKEVIEKIPSKIFNNLIEMAADSRYEVFIDVNKDLEEQNLSEECKVIVSLIYYNYIADDDEKKEIIKLWKEND